LRNLFWDTNVMKTLVLIIQIQLLCVISMLSQNLSEKPKSADLRVALVDYNEFYNEKTGVEKLSKAWFTVSDGFRPEPQLLNDGKKLAEQKRIELENKNLTPSEKAELKKSLAELNEQIQAIKKHQDEIIEKRKKIIPKPILDEIENFLEQFAKQNNLILLKVKTDDFDCFLHLNLQLDITKPIIQLLNEFFKTFLIPNKTLRIPQSKVGSINTESFFSESNGITQLAKIENEFKQKMKSELGNNPTKEQVETWSKTARRKTDSSVFKRIFELIQTFANEHGFNLILDFSKEIPTQLKNIPSDDITNRFISYYNQRNQ
jgi:Skp family chaperone for outer membrane proteins